MTSLEIIVGFLGIPTLGGVVLACLARSQRGLDRLGRTRARNGLTILGWILLAHVGLFLIGAVNQWLENGIADGWILLAMFSRILCVTLLVATGRTAILVGGQRESTEDSPLPVKQLREHSEQQSRLLLLGIVLVALPVAIPGLIALLPISIFLLLEDLIMGMNQRLRENQLLWTLALAVKHQRTLSGDLNALALSIESDRRRSFWRWLGFGRAHIRRLGQLAEEIDDGQSLTSALLNNPRLLPLDLVGAIATAEVSNSLPQALPDLAARHARRIASQLSSESIYTTIFYVWCVAMAFLHVSLFICYFIIPKFKSILEGFGADVPAVTRMFVEFGDVWATYWVVLLPLVAIPTTFMFFVQRLATGNHRHLRWLLRWFPRLESPGVLTQLAYGVEYQHDLTDHVEVLADLERQPAQRRRLERVHALIAAGTPLHVAVVDEGFVNRRESIAMESAQSLGHLSWVLHAIARKIVTSRAERFRWFVKLAEPVLLIAIGLAVAFFCLAMFMPIVQIMELY